MDNSFKLMDIKEFKERGYLQELNRRFLHPLGLALVVIKEDGAYRIGGIRDSRDNPSGIIFNFSDSWIIHCVHMILDWMAMGMKFGDTAQQYYESNKSRIHLPEYAEEFMYEIFSRINGD